MAEFVRTNFREHLMFHPKMIMFFFEILVSKSKIDRVSSLCNNVCGLPAQVETILLGP